MRTHAPPCSTHPSLSLQRRLPSPCSLQPSQGERGKDRRCLSNVAFSPSNSPCPCRPAANAPPPISTSQSFLLSLLLVSPFFSFCSVDLSASLSSQISLFPLSSCCVLVWPISSFAASGQPAFPFISPLYNLPLCFHFPNPSFLCPSLPSSSLSIHFPLLILSVCSNPSINSCLSVTVCFPALTTKQRTHVDHTEMKVAGIVCP